MIGNIDELTPIQQDYGVSFKRDDFFKPFGEYHVNGGKVRQAIYLFDKKIHELHTKYDNGVVTAASVYSPQSANIAAVAKQYGVKCISTVGGTTEKNLDILPMMRITKYYGSEIRIVAKHGMTGVIHKRMHDIAKELNYLPIEMGELMESSPESIFGGTARQVENIPDALDLLVVPTGVAIQLAGILKGIELYNKKVKKIVALCVGPTREKKLEHYFFDIYKDQRILSNSPPIEWIQHKAPYAKPYNFQICGSWIDDIYEGKAFHWCMENDIFRQIPNTLFWCVGKRSREDEVNHIIENKL